MIRSKTELMEQIRTRLGEDTGDDALTFLEDVSDTLDDLESKATDPEDWHQKYTDLDAEWRQRYRDRFYNNEAEPPDNPDPADSPVSFSDLFKED